MSKPKLIRITTVPQSLWKLLEGQLNYMRGYFEVIAISNPGEKLEIVEKREGVRVIPVEITRTINPLKDIFAIIALVKIFRNEKPDIVHTHTPKAGFVGMVSAKIAGVQHRIHTVAGMPLEAKTGLKRQILIWVEKLTYAAATNILPNSEGMKNFIFENALTSPRKVEIIGHGSSNGINTDFFKPTDTLLTKAKSIRKELKVDNRFVFGFVGRIVRDKGIEELMHAYTTLEKEFPNLSLIVLGKFEDHLDAISPEARKILDENPNIHFVGYQLDVSPYFMAMDCFVFPSYREGLPNVLLQASALSVPIVATAINGNTDIIKHEQNGLLVSPRNAEELTKAMRKMYDSESLRKAFAKTSRAIIVENYQRQLIWDKLLIKYRQLLQA